MTDDLIKRAENALEEFAKAREKYGNEIAKDVFASAARTLLPEAIEEIKRLEAKANQMVADKINLRSELISVQAKLEVAVGALEWQVSQPEAHPFMAQHARAALAEIKGEKP